MQGCAGHGPPSALADRPARRTAAPRAAALAARSGPFVLWALLAAAAGAVVAPLEPSLLEEGLVVHTATRILAGEHLYRDVIVHTGPLPYELLALLYRAFGSELAVGRICVVVLQVLGALATFGFARRAGLGALAHAAAAGVVCAPILLAPMFSIFFYSTLAFYLGLLAVYTSGRAVQDARFAPLAGALLAAVALCKQSTGLALAVALVLGVGLAAPPGARLRRALQVCIGGGLVGLAFLAPFALRGDLSALLDAQLRLAIAMVRADSFRVPLLAFWPPGRLDAASREHWVMIVPSLYHLRYGLHAALGTPIVLATQALYAAPFLALFATLLVGRRSVSSRLHGGFLAAMTLNLLPRADWGHLTVALPAAWVQLVLLAGAQMHSRRLRRVAAASAAAGLLACSAGVGLWLRDIAGAPRLGPRVPLRPISAATRGPALSRVVAYLRARTAPGEAIFVARQEPLLYFATDTRNPTPFPGVLQGARALQEPRILAALEQLRFVVMSDIDQPLYTYYSKTLPNVWAYLERHFELTRNFPIDAASWIAVYTRGPDRGATAIDLIDARAQGHAFTWAADGAREPAARPQLELAARQLRRLLPVELGPRGGGIDFELEVPADARLQLSLGYAHAVAVTRGLLHPAGLAASVAVRVAESEAFEMLARVPIATGPGEGHRWRPLEIDLAPYAGKRVTLRLAFESEHEAKPGRLAWFGSPRIALRP
jgi:hypothetical protein